MSSLDLDEIDELISHDASNVDTCKSALAATSPRFLEAISEASSLYTTLNRIFGQASDQHFREVEEAVDRLGLDSDGELLDLAESDPDIRGVVDRFVSRDVRALLIARLGVLHTQAFADFLRMRVTSPLAYLRIQAESVALLIYMSQDASVASEWSDIRTDADGRKFFRKHQKRVVEILDETDLRQIYELASGGAVHSRFAAVSRAMAITHESSEGRFRREYMVRAQEFDPEDPLLFYATVASALRVQENIFRALARFVPEVDDPIFSGSRIPRFAALVDELAEALSKLRGERDADPSDAA